MAVDEADTHVEAAARALEQSLETGDFEEPVNRLNKVGRANKRDSVKRMYGQIEKYKRAFSALLGKRQEFEQGNKDTVACGNLADDIERWDPEHRLGITHELLSAIASRIMQS